MARKKVTLDDIARETGLSKYSISRALAGKPGVSEETRQKVMAACNALGYIKKDQASPVTPDRYVVMLIPQNDAQDPSFWMKVILGVESELNKNHYTLRLRVIEQMVEGRVDNELREASAIIFAGYKSLPWVPKLKDLQKPVMVMTYPPHNMFGYDTICLSDREGACVLCEKMISMGHKKIAYFGTMDRPSMKKRFDGIYEAVKDSDAQIVAVWDRSNYYEAEDIYTELEERKEKGTLPSLIMCSTDAYAQSLMFILNKLGLRIPHDISVTGFNSDLDSTLPIPFTSMGISKKRYGEAAVYHLMHRIQRPDMPVRRIYLSPQMCLSETTRVVGEADR